jgi:hypothetical protein
LFGLCKCCSPSCWKQEKAAHEKRVQNQAY